MRQLQNQKTRLLESLASLKKLRHLDVSFAKYYPLPLLFMSTAAKLGVCRD
jgi:hypothetical protein